LGLAGLAQRRNPDQRSGVGLGRLRDERRLVAETNIGATFFAVGSTLYSSLLRRARSIPVVLAALGLAASLILVVGVPIQTAASRDTVDGAGIVIWIPMIVFETSTGAWLLIKGARAPELERAEQVTA
jgi:hypothetical protein